LMVHGYHAMRDALQVEVAAKHGYRWYHDEPNLTAGIMSLVKPDQGPYNLQTSMDVVHQGYGAMPIKGMTSSAHPLVLAGVLAHVAERTGAAAGAELAPDSPPPKGSVAEVFAEAMRTNVPVKTLMPESGDPSSLAVSDEAKARIRDALSAGSIVIVPQS